MYIVNVYLHSLNSRLNSPGIVQKIMLKVFFCCGSLYACTVICLTATKFELFKFSVLGFVFTYISNIQTIVILYEFCLFPAYFGYIIINVWNLECQIQSADGVWRTVYCRCCNFNR